MAQSKKRPATTKRPATKPTRKAVAVPVSKLPSWLAPAYMFASVAILLVTTALWSALGARLQQGNADQLVNAYLFENAQTFHQALLPGQHTFLLKWPIFWMIHLMGSSGASYIGTTVAVSLLTVGLLAGLLYRINRRPLVFGTLCLALASVLIMIPAQPYNGGLLPVNMAMIATRNLEYLVYIAALALLVRWHEIKGWGFWVAALCLSLLIASDKLFMSISLGGASLALLAYVFMRRWKMAELSLKWWLLSAFSIGASLAILWGINDLGVTHILNQTSSGAYGLVANISQLAKGLIYTVLGVMTNFGANPAYDALYIRDVPLAVRHQLVGFGSLSFVVNFMIMTAGLFVSAKFVIESLKHHHKKPFELTRSIMLSLLMIWSSLMAMVLFAVSNHYFVVDSRYLTILLFAIFIALATYSRQVNLSAKQWLTAGMVIVVTMVPGLVYSVQTHSAQAAALKPTNDRNSLIAQAMAHHSSDVLVGDYWRVIPVKAASTQKLNVMPLANCLEARQVLSSNQWQHDLSKTSFAYLLSFQKGLTDYPNCTLDQITEAYGRPNASAVVAGPVDHPDEVLLFYDGGTHKSAPTAVTKTPATVLPISLDELPYTTCVGPTIMNVVAHQDDDLLFINPDIIHDIKAGHCMRTIFVTAGDAGSNEYYWLSREQGAEAAYAEMTGDHSIWVQRIVKVADKAFITVANPRGNSKVSLVFLRLPDGNLKGQGFARYHNESLAKLYQGSIQEISSVTSQSTYTSEGLTNTLADLMRVYQPAEIRTQSSENSKEFPDHSDHINTGYFAKRAQAVYEERQFENRVKIPTTFYLGYPVRTRLPNITGLDLVESRQAFFAYAKFDPAVCQNEQQCNKVQTIHSYLERTYTAPN